MCPSGTWMTAPSPPMKKASEPVAGSGSGPILFAMSERLSWATKCSGSSLLVLGQRTLPSRGAPPNQLCARDQSLPARRWQRERSMVGIFELKACVLCFIDALRAHSKSGVDTARTDDERPWLDTAVENAQAMERAQGFRS